MHKKKLIFLAPLVQAGFLMLYFLYGLLALAGLSLQKTLSTNSLKLRLGFNGYG